MEHFEEWHPHNNPDLSFLWFALISYGPSQGIIAPKLPFLVLVLYPHLMDENSVPKLNLSSV
jgi:hypothetical protein